MNFLNYIYLVLKNQFPKTGHGRYLMTIILALGKLRQEDCLGIEARLDSLVNECQGSLGYRVNPCLKNPNQTKGARETA